MPRSQPTPDAAIVEVRGSAGRLVPADEFFLRLTVSGEHQSAGRAYRARGEAVGVIKAVLDVVGGLRAENERLSESTIHHTGATVAYWQVTAAGGVDDRERLRELTSRLAAVEGVGVDGPDWRLSPVLQARIRGELLADAARTARAEAAVLAEALGGEVGRLIYVTNQEHLGEGWPEVVMMAGTGRGAEGVLPGRTLELDLEPERIELNVTVTAEFEVVTSG